MQRAITASSMRAHIAPSIIVVDQAWKGDVQHRLPPVRREFLQPAPLSSMQLERISIQQHLHRDPMQFHDRVALKTVKILRVIADAFFRDRYIHRAIVLETVAAVPGMVAGMLRHLRSLRLMVPFALLVCLETRRRVDTPSAARSRERENALDDLDATHKAVAARALSDHGRARRLLYGLWPVLRSFS